MFYYKHKWQRNASQSICIDRELNDECLVYKHDYSLMYKIDRIFIITWTICHPHLELDRKYVFEIQFLGVRSLQILHMPPRTICHPKEVMGFYHKHHYCIYLVAVIFKV